MPCPGNWEYKDVAGHQPLLAERCEQILLRLRAGGIDKEAPQEMRPFHRTMFTGLTPPGHDYFAGHHRGEDFECLKTYEVGIKGDWRVGTISGLVAKEMGTLVTNIRAAIVALDAGWQQPGPDHATKLNMTIVVACRLFERFLKIHPYANGNGHIARLLIWFLLGRYKIWPVKWTVEPSPPPPYADLIKRARDGDHEPLEQFVYSMLRP